MGECVIKINNIHEFNLKLVCSYVSSLFQMQPLQFCPVHLRQVSLFALEVYEASWFLDKTGD